MQIDENAVQQGLSERTNALQKDLYPKTLWRINTQIKCLLTVLWLLELQQ
jgi:hypothetical protein